MQAVTTASLATGREKWLGHAAMLLFATLIAGSFSIGHLAAPHVGSAALNAVRFTFACLLMGAAVFAVLGRAPALPGPRAAGRLAILGLLMAGYFILMFYALKFASPVSTGAVFTLIPFMSAGFGWLFLRQVSRPTVLISLIIAAAGSIWVIFRGDLEAILRFDIGWGEGVFFFGCACHAAYAPLVKKFNTGEPVVEFTFWTLVASTVWIAAIGASQIASTDWTDLPAIVWWAIGYLAIFTTAGTFFLVQFASMRLPASKVLSYGYLTPAVIIVIEGAVGHGWATASVAVGALVTVMGLVFLALAPDG